MTLRQLIKLANKIGADHSSNDDILDAQIQVRLSKSVEPGDATVGIIKNPDGKPETVIISGSLNDEH